MWFTCSSWCLCTIFCYFNLRFVNSFWNIKTPLLCKKTPVMNISSYFSEFYCRHRSFFLNSECFHLFSAESKDDITVRYFTWAANSVIAYWIQYMSLYHLLFCCKFLPLVPSPHHVWKDSTVYTCLSIAFSVSGFHVRRSSSPILTQFLIFCMCAWYGWA